MWTYKSSSTNNQLLMTHIMSYIMKYLPPVRPKMVPKLKMLRIYWNFAYVIYPISQSRFSCQKLFLLNTTCSAQNGPKIKSAQNLLKFGTFDISNLPIPILMSKMTLMKYLSPVRPKSSQNWICSEFIEI